VSVLRSQSNTKRQGDVGVGTAISWFMRNGYPVYTPIGDPPDYDLVIQIDYDVFSVQVKTTYHKREAGNYIAHLRVNGGNRTGTGKTKYFDPSKVDFLFILAEDGSMYFIPASAIEARSMISLCEKYEEWRVE
jgi:hypothetical protein